MQAARKKYLWNPKREEYCCRCTVDRWPNFCQKTDFLIRVSQSATERENCLVFFPEWYPETTSLEELLTLSAKTKKVDWAAKLARAIYEGGHLSIYLTTRRLNRIIQRLDLQFIVCVVQRKRKFWASFELRSSEPKHLRRKEIFYQAFGSMVFASRNLFGGEICWWQSWPLQRQSVLLEEIWVHVLDFILRRTNMMRRSFQLSGSYDVIKDVTDLESKWSDSSFFFVFEFLLASYKLNAILQVYI